MKRRAFIAAAASALAWAPAKAQVPPRRPLIGYLSGVATGREGPKTRSLVSLGSDAADGHRSMARQLDRILKGVSAGDIPFERPTKFELVVNLRAARTLGIVLPPDVLARADEMIE